MFKCACSFSKILCNMKVVYTPKIILTLTFLVLIVDLDVIKCCSNVPDAEKEITDHEGKYYNYKNCYSR